MGIVFPGLVREFEDDIPEKLIPLWQAGGLYSFHTVKWWRNHWEKTGLVNVKHATMLSDGWEFWCKWETTLHEMGIPNSLGAPRNSPGSGISILEADEGHNIGFVQMVGCRKSG